MSRIFLSHASHDNIAAIGLRDWLLSEGWDDVFLDLDPDRGIVGGQRWERELHAAALRCKAVIFLISPTWLGSAWCMKEFTLARGLNKQLFAVIIDSATTLADLPPGITDTWQAVDLTSGQDLRLFRVQVPDSHKEGHAGFSKGGLSRLKRGLESAGLDPTFFVWPPPGDPDRAPYRGLRPLEADDAGIIFGRDALIAEAVKTLRGLAAGAPPRLFVILGASGAGKSSFLRAGLLPRLARDDRRFLPLVPIRPERAAITGDNGLLAALEAALPDRTRAALREAIEAGAAGVGPLLAGLVDAAAAGQGIAPVVVVSIDQAEELFVAEAHDEAQSFLRLLHDLLMELTPAVIAVFTIRTDNYEALQIAEALDGVRQETLSLPAIPKGSYSEIIKGPVRRLDGTPRALKIEDGLVEALLADIEADGNAKDALPLLAFALERLFLEYHAGGILKLSHYEKLGRIKGSIEAAVERAFTAADSDPSIPREREARLALLRRGLIPWLAGIDPDTGAPRRRIARPSEIPVEARPLIARLVDQRLLATDVVKRSGERTIEPSHESLLRQWGVLEGWLAEDAALLSIMDGVKRAARDWAAKGETAAWLTHVTGRLEATRELRKRPDLAAHLDKTDIAYLAGCSQVEAVAKRRKRLAAGTIYCLLGGIILGLIAWINHTYIRQQIDWAFTMKPYMIKHIRPYVLTAAREKALRTGDTFRECDAKCPDMVVVPGGGFDMGSTGGGAGHPDNEVPKHPVTFAHRFAVSRYEVTSEQWGACVAVGACAPLLGTRAVSTTQPVTGVSWDEVQQYVVWFSRMTGKSYRLMTESEWEYAARAGSTKEYAWGNEIKKDGKTMANCVGCGSQWDGTKTAPVGSFEANGFGLYDMYGNAWTWIQDCYHDTYKGAPGDGSAWNEVDCSQRVVRGGAAYLLPQYLRSAYRNWYNPEDRTTYIGFRITRVLQ